MEHRYGQRARSKVEAWIYSGGRPSGVGCISNFSSSGLFIRTRCLGLRPHQHLEIVCNPDASTPCRVAVGVVRATVHGVGVVLDEYDPAARRVAAILREGSMHAGGAGLPALPPNPFTAGSSVTPNR